MGKSGQPKYAAKALQAFYTQQGRMVTGYTTHYEHGQLWIVSKTGAIWSVVDAEGPWSVDGFDFELVKEMSSDAR
jgi:hypothetical protein